MNTEAFNELNQFFVELQRESDRGLALVGPAHIDEKLLQVLTAFLCHEKASSRLLTEGNSPLGTFSSRTDACLALGFIDEFEYAEISLVRKIRNEFAHTTHGTTFKSPRIAGLFFPKVGNAIRHRIRLYRKGAIREFDCCTRVSLVSSSRGCAPRKARIKSMGQTRRYKMAFSRRRTA